MIFKPQWHLLLIVTLCNIGMFSGPVYAQTYTQTPPLIIQPTKSTPKESRILKKANQAFNDKHYDEAINLYRKIVRKNRKHWDAWTQLGAAYYHTGIPKRGLRYLRFSEKKTSLGSFNHFYQGLCYDALSQRAKARNSFKKSANYQDSYGARSMFELGVTDYNIKSYQTASHWLNLYVQKYPSGYYRNVALKLLQSIKQGVHIEGIDGVQKPSMESALYKYNSLSLHDSPHYWFTQLGFEFDDRTQKYPKEGGGLVTKPDQRQAIIANAGVGIGPRRQGRATLWGGYTYRQNWYTNGERVETYRKDLTDFAYQPFRLDLLERRHDFYGDIRLSLPHNIFTGLFSKIQFARIGSSFYHGPEAESFDPKVQKISDTTLNIPWIGYAWNKNSRTLAYLYFRKEINEETPEFSNKSYSFEGAENAPFSFGLSHSHSFPDINLDLNAEIFQYSFIANDYWLDYTRQGFIGSAEYEVYKDAYVTLIGGYYQDSYPESIHKSQGCKSSPVITTGIDAPTSTPEECFREDSGFLVTVKAYWNYTAFHRIEAEVTYLNNSNPVLQEYDKQAKLYKVTATMAFPSVKRVLRQVDRFSDNAFTKEPE